VIVAVSSFLQATKSSVAKSKKDNNQLFFEEFIITTTL